MIFNYRAVCLVLSTFAFSCAIFAKPDVLFKDNTAYLKHELKDKAVKFIFSEVVPGYDLPGEFFDRKSLIRYFDERHVFPSDEMKLEFLRMMRSSFESNFTFNEFISELQKVLAGYQQFKAGLENGSGCSSANLPSSMLFLVAGLALFIRRQKGR